MNRTTRTSGSRIPGGVKTLWPRLVATAFLLVAALSLPGRPAHAQGRGAGPEAVVVGAYISDIQRIDLKLHSYEVNFYIWLRWRNPDLSPAETIEFLNTSELHKLKVIPEYKEPLKLPNGEFYQLIRVQGLFSKKLPLYNYPFDRQKLTVVFEDSVLESNRLVYVADEEDITLNAELTLPGFRIGSPRLEIASFVYPTRFGDLRSDHPRSFSRVSLEVPLSRPIAANTIKLLLPVLSVVVCASFMFLVRPTHVGALIGIGITALLTIVALQITTNEDLPDLGYLILMDKIYISAYIFIIAGLGVVVRTSKLIDGNGLEAATKLQRRSLAILSGLFLVAFVALVAGVLISG